MTLKGGKERKPGHKRDEVIACFRKHFTFLLFSAVPSSVVTQLITIKTLQVSYFSYIVLLYRNLQQLFLSLDYLSKEVIYLKALLIKRKLFVVLYFMPS